MAETHTAKEIGALMRTQLDKGILPTTLPASVYAREVEVTRNAELHLMMPGELLSRGIGREDAMKKVMPDLHFTDKWVGVAEDGVVAQWTMVGTKPDGTAFRTPFCQIFHIENRVITRVNLFAEAANMMGDVGAQVFSQP